MTGFEEAVPDTSKTQNITRRTLNKLLRNTCNHTLYLHSSSNMCFSRPDSRKLAAALLYNHRVLVITLALNHTNLQLEIDATEGECK